MKTKIIYEDQSVLVCRKPAGLATQTSSGFQADMVSELKNELSRKTGEKNPYLGLVHRLDQPVEGLLVFGKTKNASAELTKQLADGRLHKKYIAVLEGVLPEPEGTLIDHLKKDSRSNLSIVVSEKDNAAKRAELHYRLLAAYGDCCLAEIEIATGRHHQIRVQMAHLGYPLRNDGKYGVRTVQNVGSAARYGTVQSAGSAARCGTAQSDLARQGGSMNPGSLALCAYALSFTHPAGGKRMEFAVRPENPVFAEFAEALKTETERGSAIKES